MKLSDFDPNPGSRVKGQWILPKIYISPYNLTWECPIMLLLVRKVRNEKSNISSLEWVRVRVKSRVKVKVQSQILHFSPQKELVTSISGKPLVDLVHTYPTGTL